MAPNSTAERCGKYRQKHKGVYREKDALRKRNYRQNMKANPIANEERLRVQQEKKQKSRQRVKESIATATSANLVAEQNDDSAFSQAHRRSKSILKVAKTLPKSPRKRKGVISALTNKFKLHIRPTQSKAGRPKNVLTEGEKEWLKSFLDKSYITCDTPVGKITVVLRKLTLNDLLNITNGSSLIKDEFSFEFSFSKKIKQLYEYIKSNWEYV